MNAKTTSGPSKPRTTTPRKRGRKVAQDTAATPALDAPSASDEAPISDAPADVTPALSLAADTEKPARKRAPRRKKAETESLPAEVSTTESLSSTEEAAPPKRRGRPRKAALASTDENTTESTVKVAAEHDTATAPKRGRTARAKTPSTDGVEAEDAVVKPVRRRGRPKKTDATSATVEDTPSEQLVAPIEAEAAVTQAAPPAPRRRGRPKKVQDILAETDPVDSTESKPTKKTRRPRKTVASVVQEEASAEQIQHEDAITTAPTVDATKAEPENSTHSVESAQPETPQDAASPPATAEDDRPLFASLPLGEPIMRAIQELGYLHPTPIQAQAIPEVLKGHDVLGVAQTGTGKTASFTLPMLEKLSGSRARARMPRSLILEPTRELALQVADNFKLYGKHLRLSHALLIGGESMAEQREVLNRGVDVLIATPGRLLDMFARGGLLMTQTSLFVIDEADRMLDMGFIPDIEKIVTLLPAHRQTLFFSATMAPEIRRLADAFLRQPVEITVSRPSSVASTIEEKLIIVEEDTKRRALRKMLQSLTAQNAIVFCNRKRDVDMLQRYLTKHGFAAGHLHGDLAQSLRFATLERFKSGDLQILVCSDVAARGIDIGGLSYVFNYDLPFNAEDYVHRIGRTGRAGKQGHAISIAAPKDRELVEAIEALVGKTIEPTTFPNIETIGWDHLPATEAAPAPQAEPLPQQEDEHSQHAGEGKKRKRRRGGRNKRNGQDTQQDATPDVVPASIPRQEEPVRAHGVSIELAPAFENDVPRTGFGGDTPAFMLIPRRRRSAVPAQDSDRNAPIQHDGRHYGDE
nr:DEAD/DEAH box helicase [uncultured Neokomagataea sp.]